MRQNHSIALLGLYTGVETSKRTCQGLGFWPQYQFCAMEKEYGEVHFFWAKPQVPSKYPETSIF